MDSAIYALQLLREELRTEFTVILEEGLAKIDARMQQAIDSLRLLNGDQLDDDDEMGSSADFINDVPSVSGSGSGSCSSSEEDKMQEEEDEEDKRPKKKAKAKLAPPVHYKMKPTVGKRVRRAPNRFSPSRTQQPSSSSVSISNSESDKYARADRDQWNTVCQKNAAQRMRIPWYARKIDGPLHQIRSALGRESANNQGPRDLWDDIGHDPEAVEILQLAAARKTKCAMCGSMKPCTFRIWIGERDGGYVGSSCAGLARAWRDMAQVLESADHGEWHRVQDALDAVQSAHADKASRNH